jgi:putative ubiquitin-RnfH superfamily antitoxin RatB of RatAB toxin-antitoxin module
MAPADAPATVDGGAPVPASGVGAGAGITVELVFGAAPQQVDRLVLRLPAGATALDALRASGLGERLAPAVFDGLKLGLWGRLCEPDQVLRDLDRLELLRSLLADPMEARRRRLRRDGLRKVTVRA